MKLTKGEEEIMKIIWEIEACLVSDIIDYIGIPITPHSMISSIVRILEKKGVVDDKAYGRPHEYFSLVSKEKYSGARSKKMMKDYVDASATRLVSFLVNEKEIDSEELNELLNQMEKEEDA